MTTDRELTQTVITPRDERLARQRAVREYLAMEPGDRDRHDFDALVSKHLEAIRTERN